MEPAIRHLHAVTEALQQEGIPYSLGGSGLLHALGLTDTVHDWDVMTEAPKEQVLKALLHLDVQEKPCGDYPFGTEYKLLVHSDHPQVEILGHFSIYTEKGRCKLPNISSGLWNGVQVGSPEVWCVAYALMNRRDKSDLLLSFLREKGANQQILQMLKNEPLADESAASLLSLE
ncbi:hypothetical protein [Paenibacillus aestuarii]|uniref:Nucleotidyltransferase family protein n=1 Tax=Paenibacillus aestuarii TaxID=516965 RepID=A0ABW0K5U3_9BACL|nr:hypothetical protein [Paenibacillus aestuarii]